MTEILEAVQGIAYEKGINADLIRQVIQEVMKAAYKKHFGTDENALVEFDVLSGTINVYSRKEVVADDDLYDPVAEIELKDALKIDPQAKVGQFIEVKIDTSEFDRMDVMNARQKAKQILRDILKDTLFSEFKDKVNEIIIGYIRRERNGTIYVDLGKAEGILPKKNQSPKETYRPGDKIKCLVQEVKKAPTGLQIILTRRDPAFVKKLFELEVPEINDGVVIIHKIVREAGFRTKIAVRSTKEDVDPVGACVGLKGSRIQNVMKELEGERIDILRYDPDPQTYIAHALSSAKVLQVIITDPVKKNALAIVNENDLSLAIGKMGTNVKLANRLVDWNIDVRTEQQFAEMDIYQDYRAAANELFEGGDESELITEIRQLDGISERVLDILEQNGYIYIENLINLKREDLEKINGLSPQDIDTILRVLEENVEVIYEDRDNEEETESTVEEEIEEQDDSEETEEYACPECGFPVKIGMSNCPNCGVGLKFEYEEEDEE